MHRGTGEGKFLGSREAPKLKTHLKKVSELLVEGVDIYAPPPNVD